MPFVQTPAGVTLHYEERGCGRPVVFLHGWAMSSRVWRFQQCECDYRLICLDQRGHGGSPPSAGYTVDDFARDLVSFFQEMSLEGAVLIGWSMGVLVALKAFHLLRSRLAGVVLVAGTPRFTVAADFPHGLSAAEVKALAAGLRRDYQKTMGEFFKRMFAKGEIDRSQYQRIVHEIVMGGGSPDRDAARESLQILTSLDLRDRLPLVDRPVLLIHGELDTICPAAASAYMADRLPEAALQIMPGCGHAPFMTRPEQFNGIVARFLAGL